VDGFPFSPAPRSTGRWSHDITTTASSDRRPRHYPTAFAGDDARTIPDWRLRLAIALLLGVVSSAYCGWSISVARVPSDFEFWWRAARVLLDHGDPYLRIENTSGWPLPDRLFYPMPALLVAIPFARMPLPLAAGMMLGVGSGLLAWVLSRDGFWRLWIFATPSFVMALKVGQWSPVLTVAAFVPALGWLAAVKPTLGLSVLSYRLDWRAFVGAALVTVASLAILPAWPLEWITNLHHLLSHPSPIVTPLGMVLILALLRWRTPEGRLLLAMACVPQLLFFADQLPVYLVARSRAQLVWLACCGVIAWSTWFLRLKAGDLYVTAAAPYVMVGVYAPALLVILFGDKRRQWLAKAG
jgi:hypothetical protein